MENEGDISSWGFKNVEHDSSITKGGTKYTKYLEKKAQKYTLFKNDWNQMKKGSCTRKIPSWIGEVYARTERFKQSSIGYLPNILNIYANMSLNQVLLSNISQL